jgi:hypothetical protein
MCVWGEIKKSLESNKNENTTCQNLWVIAKAVLKGKFIIMSTFLKKTLKYVPQALRKT